MSDVVGINEAISPGSGIVVKTLCTGEIVDVCDDTSLYKMWHCSDMDSMWDVHFYVYAVPIEVMPPPLIEQPDVVMMEPDEGPPICPTFQVKPKRKGNSLKSSEENTKIVKKLRASEVLEKELDDLPHMNFSDDEPNIEFEGRVGLEGDAPVNVETEGEVRLGREAPVNAETEMFYARINPDGTTFSMRASSNLIHTCPGRSGQSNTNVNAQWMAKEVKEIIRTVKTTRPTSMKELILRSLAKCSKDLQSNQCKSLLVMFKPTNQENHFLPPPLGIPATPRPRVARSPKRVDTNVSMARHMSNIGLPPAIPNMRGRGSGGIGGGGGGGGGGLLGVQDKLKILKPQGQLKQVKPQGKLGHQYTKFKSQGKHNQGKLKAKLKLLKA
ncbi:hypothetical protein GIB67_039254 [Kingdonia uniflora]|uniref:Uncharacterized protein n=1 Tax=Kingdonia uniflora TaxID=39325 RepID=A0A7J7MM03_9MAGN|nr:hypothetical protein GIB67_039254 [Kingdonia uniflora]